MKATTKTQSSYSVYIHDFPNGKKYVGITSQTPPEQRWKRGRGYNHNIHITRAIKKYGWDNIKHSIIARGLTCEQAQEKERELIAFFNSSNPKYGYNITKGGEKAGKFTIETRKKISTSKMGTHASDEMCKKIDMYSLNGEYIRTFRSITDATKFVGVKKSNIASVCNGKYKTSHGYVWRFCGEPYTKHIVEHGDNYKAVDMYSLNGEYIRSFEKIGNVEHEGIAKARSVSAVCNGHRRQTKGYIFRFKGDAFDKYTSQKHYFKKKVAQIDDNGNVIQIYESLIDACNAMNLSRSAIGASIRRKSKSGGYVWKYA